LLDPSKGAPEHEHVHEDEYVHEYEDEEERRGTRDPILCQLLGLQRRV
jgi:hypothetical protein